MLIVWQVWLATEAFEWLGDFGVGTLYNGLENFNLGARAIAETYAYEPWLIR